MKLQSSSITLALAAVLVAAAMPASAGIVLGAGTDRSICPDATFNACYIGVDGTQTATASGGTSVSFIGLGVASADIAGVTFPAGGAPSTPNGTLTVGAGSLVAVTGDGSQGVNSSVLLGNGAGSTGTLLVNNGGFLAAPLVYVGQQDARASTGVMTIASGGVVQATVDAGPTGPIPGIAGVNVGRGAGSTGAVTVTGAGSTLLSSGASISIGRAGTGSLDVLAGGTVATAGSVYGSTAALTGVSQVTVDGTGSALFAGGKVLIGVATDPATGTQLNQTPLPSSTVHGTSTLTVAHGGAVAATEVVIGAGGTVQGDGTIAADLSVYGGTVKPGNSPGTLHVTGNYLMDGGTYVVEVGPTANDLIDVAGNASISNATILFSFIDGFAPAAGFGMSFLNAASLVTSNVTFAYQGLEAGFTFITAAQNGQFLFLATSNGVAAAIPEPSPLWLLLLGSIGLVTMHRRTRASARRFAVVAMRRT